VRANEFMHLLKRKPFIPVRIHMTDGEVYDIFHPDNILVTHSYASIGRGAEPDGVVDRVDHCSLIHIVRIEELSQKTDPKNGKS
jgi:hypothetical protein